MAAWLGVMELTAGAAALAMALLVAAASPRRSDNRALALLLAVDGAGWLGIAGGLVNLGVAPAVTTVIVRATVAASPWLFALFVVHALDVPLTRPLRRRAGTAALGGMALLVPTLVLGVLDDVAWYQAVNRYVGLISGPNVAVAAGALAAAVQWTRRSRDPRAAKAYLNAFALRSVALLILFGAVLVAKNLAVDSRLLLVAETVAVSLLVVHIGYLLYGILSGQVLGLDDKVRATIQKAVVLTTVASIFLILTEGMEILIGVDSPVLGLLAAVVITLAFLPIHAGAERLARRLLPQAARTPDMPRNERLAWLNKEVRIAMADGRLGEKERLMLESSRQHLGLTEQDLEDALDDVRTGGPVNGQG